MCALVTVVKNHIYTVKNYWKNILVQRNKSSLGLWETDINTEIKLKVEQHWYPEVSKSYENKCNQGSLYVLPMFPYPSGNLHMGHVRVYSISDALARFHKLNGYNTIHPIGWDAFGLPAENAAIEHKIPPFEWTRSNISFMKRQLLQLGFNFDWERELCTCDPKYYKWTQYIFLKLLENGLAYQSKALVNWDPVDKTVLADEQVDEFGFSWRSGAKVEQKYLTQWFLRTTKYAKKLYDGLNSKDLENWKDIINLQKHWIGECNGILVKFTININDKIRLFDVWTSDPYKLIHGDFVTISSTHVFAQELGNKEYEMICYNPVTKAKMPVYVSDAVDYPKGRYTYLGSSQVCEEDKKFAAMLNIPISKDNIEINIENENQKAIAKATDSNIGGFFVSSSLKDWLISRQRYWGTPIPIIHCPNCGSVPVPYHQLPVELPKMDTSTFGIQTLASVETWVNCKCPKCQLNAKRETDTMDTFVDSSWYYYRFLDPHNESMPFNKDSLVGLAPVDIYIGGKEHAVLHLYYARFMSYFLNSLGWTPTEEPFKKLLVQGMIMGQSYKLKSSGKYISPENVEKVGKEYKEKHTGENLVVQWEKMSKSKYNGENPERLLSTYGCDTTRLLILADVPPATARRWSDATLPGVLNWQHRLWMTIRSFLKCRDNNSSDVSALSPDQFSEMENKIWESRNFMTATATYHFKHTHKLSVGISRLQSLTNTLRNNVPPEIISKSKEFELALGALIIMLSPVTPHFCSELWAGFTSAPQRVCETTKWMNWNKNVLEQRWPTVDDHYKLSFLCKIDGADVCDLKIKASDLVNLNYEYALQLMLDQEVVQKRVRGGIMNTNYELYPGCRAILSIFTNRKQKSVAKQTAQNI